MDRPGGRKVLKFDGLSGRGLWIALRAILIKSALRIYLSVSYDMISTTIMSHLRWLPPFGALRHHLPPAERWDYKDMKGSLLIVDSTVLLYRWRQPPKRGGMHFLARRAVVKVLYKPAPSINLEAPTTTLSDRAAVKLKNPRGDSPVKL